MINLPSNITINPPPFTDGATNKVVTPAPIVTNNLSVSFVDTPSNKTLVAYLNGFPGSYMLFSGDQYDIMGDWTQTQADKALLSQLGTTPEQIEKTIQGMYPKTLEQNPNGPGTILTGMISSLGIKSTSNCSCRRHALEMNDKGNDWCEQNIDTILGWLKEESNKRNLPYVELVAKAMVQRAINKSRRLLAKESSNVKT